MKLAICKKAKRCDTESTKQSAKSYHISITSNVQPQQGNELFFKEQRILSDTMSCHKRTMYFKQEDF